MKQETTALKLQDRTDMITKPRVYNRLDVRFMLIIGVFLAIVLASIFWYMSDRAQESIISELHTEAKIAFEQVVITRHWNAKYSGVYVEKIKGVESNPYLRKLGVEPDIQSVDGRNFTLKNPEIMTRELSIISKESEILEFHITSLDSVNPANTPDDFERKALESYNIGETEATQIVLRNGSFSYQYMAPLYITKECQKCHKSYNIGEVRGGISVFLPMNDAYNDIQTTKRNMLAGSVGLIAGVEILLFIIVNSLIFRPIGELKKGAQNLGSGDLQYRIPVKTRDEIGILGTVFNTMASDLFENIREVENSKEKWMAIFTEARDSIVLIDPKTGNIIDCNPEFERQTGREKKQLIEMKIWEIITPQKKDDEKAKFLEIIEKGSFGSKELEYQKPDGKIVPIESVMSVISIQGKRYILSISRDITERKHAQEELMLAKDEALSASSFKSELLMKMSHELRTPLNAILGFSDLLNMKQPGELNKTQEQYISTISKSGKHLLGIINDMLELAKVESDQKLRLSIEPFFTPEAIDETLVFVQEKAQQKNIIIKKEIDPELDIIHADKIRFKQILLKLLDNAIKFSKPGGGTILITARKAGDMEQFSVSDTGIGIKKENIGKLFNMFYQEESGIHRKYGGTGAGLAIIKQLVEQQGGRIWVESKYGQGSIFTFTLPLGVRKEEKT